jgi:hypothetical protein
LVYYKTYKKALKIIIAIKCYYGIIAKYLAYTPLVRNILRGLKMKTRTLVSILILVLAVLIIAGSCATMKKEISETDFFEAYSGTWINTDYSGDSWGRQKKIHFPDYEKLKNIRNCT